MTKLYIFDVDGTLRWTTISGARFPVGPDQWRLMPKVAARLRSIGFSETGPFMACASNQCGVGDGVITADLARRLIEDAVTAAVGRLPPRFALEMCICREGADCARQKPRPGMLHSLLRRFGVTAADALYVGDIAIDAEAAAQAGIPFVFAHEFFRWEARDG